MKDTAIYSVLMITGALPFAACALLIATGTTALPFLGPLDRLATLFGLAIICFLTGVHWATQLYAKNPLSLNLFLVSNAVFLAVLIAYVLDLQWAIATQLAAFPLLLAIDHRLRGHGLLARDYLRPRSFATAIAWFSLLTILVA